MPDDYLNPGPSREVIDSAEGPVVLEFGTAWCGHCQSAAAGIAEALRDYPTTAHIKVEDGPGRRLGRSFHVKLWPTLIFLKDGIEHERAVRPAGAEEIRRGLAKIAR